KIAHPILIGRRSVIDKRIKRYGLRLRRDEHFTNVDPEDDPRYREYWEEYRQMLGRQGVTAQYAKLEMRRRTTLIGAMLIRKGEADGMICGTISATGRHLKYVERVLGRQAGASVFAGMSALLLPGRTLFLADTHVNMDPSAEELAEITLLAAEGVRSFGIEPKVALISHSNFGSSHAPSALKMRRAVELVRERAPELEIDGE